MNKICLKYRNQLGEKQYQLSKINIKGVKSLTDIRLLNEHISDLLKVLKTFRCDGTEYLEPEPKIKSKKSSTKLKLNRELDPKKLFIRDGKRKSSPDILPPKKRKSLRN